MSLIKSESKRELETLEMIEKSIRRRERIHHLLIAGLATLLVGAVVAHVTTGFCPLKKLMHKK